ncbi:MAG TPA: MFS transporter [Phenylobacterium sp.]|uniref:MFS transporter n=1 Tax=Phenylobacterium sp. TaxID=1871053 RepID=UPI002D5901CD|nr:MFS transporter [Phenylobacterium sp.]HZZ70177.1 MFS transporter [Phenylobacterium sp.]
MFCIAAILSYSDRQILSLLVDPIRADLHITDVQVGLLQGAAFALIYAVAGVALGRAADVLPRRLVIVGGIAVWSLATVACGYASSFSALFAARAAVGIGEAALAPAAMSIITDSFPANRRGAGAGAFLMGMVIGGGVAISLGGFILQAAQAGALRGMPVLGALAPWRAGLVILGLLGLPVALLAATVPEPARRHLIAGEGGRPAPLRDAALRLAALWPALAPLYAAMGLASLCDFAILNWVPTLLIRRFGVGVAEIGGVLGGVVIVGGIAGSFGVGLVADRMVRRGGGASRLRLAVWSMLAVGLVSTLFIVAPSPPLVFAFAGLWIFASTTGQALGLTVLQELAPGDARGLSVSLASLINIGIGLALGAALPALILQHLLHSSTEVGAAITLVALPSAVVATLLYRLALTAARKIDRT